MQQTLVLGIGNTLLQDEGAGIHALHLLQYEFPNNPHLEFIDGGTLSFTLARWIENSENLIVFDAAETGGPPGTVKCLENEDMDHYLGTSKRSPHEVGLLDLLDIARMTQSLPERRAIIAIQPETIDWGMYCTDAVATSLPVAIEHASRLIRQWHPDSFEDNDLQEARAS